jgi:hypothetical protein
VPPSCNGIDRCPRLNADWTDSSSRSSLISHHL